jgi:hypothetical protein
MDGTVSEGELQVQLFRLFRRNKQRQLSLRSPALLCFLLIGSWATSNSLPAHRQAFTSAHHLISAFQLLDKDKDGAVSLADLRDFLSLESEEGDPFLWQTLIGSISGDTQDCFFYEDLYKFMVKQ